jgi:hypothetical protein
MDQIFAEVLGGNKNTDFIIVPHQFSDDTNRLIQLIKSTIQESLPDSHEIRVERWPEITEPSQQLDPASVAVEEQDHDQYNQAENPAPPSEAPTDPTNFQGETQVNNHVDDQADNETLFSRSQYPNDGANIQYTQAMSNLSKATEKLLGVAELLLQRLESPTAPLTTIQTESNSQGASTSLTSESSIGIIKQAVLQALQEAKNQDEDEKRVNERMVKIGEEVVVNTMSVLQESVHKSIDNNLPVLQEEIRDQIRDSTKALQKLISAPTRQFSGETAMAVNTLISPKLEAMVNMLKQVALLVEVASMSPKNSALGDALSETSSAYKILNDILHANRHMQYEISKGYEALNSLVVEVHETIARENRKEIEKESKLRGFVRNVKVFKELFCKETLESSRQDAIEHVLNYIETTSQLHAQLELQVAEPQGDDEDSIEEEPVATVPDLKSPPENKAAVHAEPEKEVNITEGPASEEEVMVAECVVVTVRDHFESAEAEEEEQIEIAKVLSIMEQLSEKDISEDKIPALSDDEFRKLQQAAADQESLDRQRRDQEEEQIRREIEEMGISTDLSPSPRKNDEEALLNTPKQKLEPIVVTPKEPHNAHVGEIIFQDDREVSNLTAPSAVLAGPSPEASHESDESTVTSDKVEPTVDQSSVASATRAMLPRSCKKTKLSQ